VSEIANRPDVAEGCAYRVNRDLFLNCIASLLRFHSSATYEVAPVTIGDLRPLCKFVSPSRIAEAATLEAIFRASELALFEPAVLMFPGGLAQLIAPPVVELRPEGMILCDGMHRVFLMRSRQYREVTALLVNGVTLPLPGRPGNWADVRVSGQEHTLEEKFTEFNVAGFTGYTRVFNSSVVWTRLRRGPVSTPDEVVRQLIRMCDAPHAEGAEQH
jgi:hypothetical protein